MTERQYKDSGIEWIGDIPNDWDVKRIKYAVVEMGSGTTPSSDNSHFYGGDIPWIQSGDLYNTPLITKTSKTVTEKAFQSCSALKIFHKPYIVIAMYGASVGNVSMSLIDACTNQACCVIKPNANNNLAYLKYWLEICKTDFINKSVGGGQPNISQDKIREQAYICPSLEEQQQIADFLDSKTASIDSAIQAQKAIIEKLKEYKQAVITNSIEKYVDKDTKMSRLKFFTYMKGRIGWQGLGSDDFISEGPYCITSTDFENDKVNWEKCYHVSEERYEMDPKIQVKIGDILISKDGTIGKLARISELPGKACLNSHLLILRSNPEILNSDYLYYLLKSQLFVNYYKFSSNGSIMQSLSQKNMAQFSVPLLPVEIQKQIALYLDTEILKIDKAIEQKNAIIEKLEEYKKSIIYNAVTGKIDCRKDVIPE